MKKTKSKKNKSWKWKSLIVIVNWNFIWIVTSLWTPDEGFFQALCGLDAVMLAFGFTAALVWIIAYGTEERKRENE
jgi:hypothetical protein